ncbi:MAG TPA: universal stress protein [Acidimicrobiales bacterium]|nr:universal stress protein [Acidimicrobiales bacterium]
MNPIRTVAVGFDGSHDAEQAVHWAARLCATTGAHLKVIHAVGLLEHAGLSTQQPVVPENALNIAYEAGLTPPDVDWSAVDGDPCSALLRVTGPPHHVDLLVVGTRGAGQHAGTVLGSTSLELAEKSTVPVTVIPSGSA